MASVSTIYDVQVKYRLSDRASKGLSLIDKRASAAARATGGLGRSLRNIAGLAVGAFGMKKAIDATVGFNRSLERTQSQLRTIIQLNTGQSFEESNRASAALMEQMRTDAKQTAGTFQDMVTFSSAIAGPITRAGGSLEDLREITKGAVVAAAAFGERADLAQLDITQALAGTLGAKDRFAKAILGPMGITAKEFNKLTEPQRLRTLKEAFDQKGIKDAAKAFESSFEGSFSTFVSGLQEFGGKVGAKLFVRLNQELQRLNKWFSQSEKRVERFADKLANGMVKAFEFAKRAFSFIVEHKDLLLTMAKAFLVTKAAGAIAGPFLAFNNALGGATGKLGSFAGALGGALQAFGVGFGVGTVIDQATGASDRLSTAFDNLINKTDAVSRGIHVTTTGDESTPLGRAANLETRAAGARSFAEKKLARLDREVASAGGFFLDAVKKNQAEARKQLAVQLSGAKKLEMEAAMLRATEGGRIAKSVGAEVSRGIASVFDIFAKGPTKASEAKVQDKKHQTNVGKIVIQVDSNDPDRFALGLEGLFSDLASNGAAASNALREGGF